MDQTEKIQNKRPSKKIKTEGVLSQILNLIPSIKSVGDIRQIRALLCCCGVNDIEEVEKELLKQTKIPYSPLKWSHQTEKQAFITDILFPIQLEEPSELLYTIYGNPLVHSKLALCSKHQDPLSMIHLSNLIKWHYDDDGYIPESITKIQESLKERGESYFNDQIKEQDIPFFKVGEFARLINKKTDYYQKGEETDIRCKYRLASFKKTVEELKEISQDYPPAYINLGHLEKEKDQKQRFFEKAIDCDVSIGYLELGLLFLNNDAEKGIGYLNMAGKKGIPSAFMLLAEYFSDKKEYPKMIEMYEKAGPLHPLAYIKLGKIHQRKHKEKSDSYFRQDKMNGYKYTIIKDGEKLKEDYFSKIIKIRD